MSLDKMPPSVMVIADGSQFGTRVLDANGNTIPCKAVYFSHNSDGSPQMTITLARGWELRYEGPVKLWVLPETEPGGAA